MKTIPIPLIYSSWPFLLILIVWLCSCFSTSPYVSSQCLDDQRSLLLEFKNNLTFGSMNLGWNESTDCCQWSGITCDNNSSGRVIGLTVVDFSVISGSINNSCSLFHLRFLKSLNLQKNNLQGEIPSTIGKLQYLEELYISSTNFSGVIPSSISNLERLRSLDLSNNHFSGPIPSFSSMKNLKHLYVSGNNFNGSMNSTEWDKLLELEQVDLSGNSLDGSIPTSLFSLPSLYQIQLNGNKFSGLNEFPSIASSKMSDIDLSNNNLEGPIPKSLFKLSQLSYLDLSSNRFNGTLDLADDILHSFKNLVSLDLSNNRLSITTNGGGGSGGGGENSSFPQLTYLYLASCNLHTIPKFLKNQIYLVNLDLSMNHITGTMPGWMWKVNRFLNLSSNHLEKLEPPSTLSNIDLFGDYLPTDAFYIDLHSNNLQGQFPAFTSRYTYLDFSNNNFSSIDPDIGNHLSQALYLSFSRNNLHGSIPASLCNATSLVLLNLEHNHFSGTIPDCLSALTQLIVLNLRGNQLYGEIPATIGESSELQTLDLNGNFLQGRIPRSLANCTKIQVLDFGDNKLNDTFPCHLKSLSKLQVLVLQSNKLHGTIVCQENHSIWPSLQIMDISSNHFIGELKAQSLFNWTSMMEDGTTRGQSKPSLLQYSIFDNQHYQNSVSLTFKGNTYELQYILTIFTSIDFSNNAFHGELPQKLGNLNGLVALNLSHNSFSGHIPSSIGNLSQVESLDLSSNAFTGRIPAEFANLNFLGYLNLSFNRLSGKIPTSTQLQSFNASSYEGNQGLFGPSLTPFHPIPVTPPTSSGGLSNWSSKSEREWLLMGAGVGFPVGITVFIGPILYIRRYREWYCNHLHRLVMKILRREDNSTRARRRKRNQQRQSRNTSG